jgi:tetratricopeptide (TPR) repeat protein
MLDVDNTVSGPDVAETEAKTATEHALAAEAAGDYSGAVVHWRCVINAQPANWNAVFRLIGALIRSSQEAEAEAVATEGVAMFPEQSALALEYGWLAARRKSWSEAVVRWQAALARFPDEPRIYAALGAGLTATQRFVEAETLLSAAVLRFDTHPQVASEYAALAARQGQWTEAASRWRRVSTLTPRNADPLGRLAYCLRQAGQADEARATLLQAEADLPPNQMVAIELATVMEPDWEAAIPRWRHIVDIFPGHTQGYLGLAAALVRSGSPDLAEPVLQAAAERFPRDTRIAHDFAHLATDRRDWTAALTRWETLRALDPNSTTAYHRIGEARWGATLDTLLEAPPTIERFQRQEGAEFNDTLSETDLIMQFESLGENCEFGLVQRYYNAEPLGLLRFAATSLSMLLEALKTRFAGVGEPEYTTLTANPGEYITGDRRYGMASHTFINPRSVAAEALFPKQCKRLSFLRNKLLDDLALGEKIFVILATAGSTEDAARELQAAIRSYGPAKLLFMRANVAGHESGSLDVAEDGLMFGYLDRYGRSGGEGWNISNAVWLNVCRKAYDVVKSSSD